MRITIATGPLLPVPAIEGGAVPRMWQGLAECFAANGHEVTIVAKAHPHQPLTEKLGGVHFRRFGGFQQSNSIYRDLLLNLGYALCALPRLPHGDILVTNDFWLPALAPLLRNRCGHVVINANRFPKRQYRLYRYVRAVAAASHAVGAAIAAQAPVLARRVRVIPNALEVASFQAPVTAAIAPVQDTLKVLYAGRIHPEKGLSLLIEAVRIAVDAGAAIELTIIGPYRADQGGGGANYLAQLRTQAGAAVRFLEPEFDVGRLAAVYRQHQIFCYPSIAETGESFGLAPVEAMAAGLAPVVSALSCFDDFIDDGRTGFKFNHRAADAPRRCAEIFLRLQADPEQLARCRDEARERATRYDFKVVAAQYLDLFSELLEQD